MHELLTALLVGAALHARDRLMTEHGAFMPPDAFRTVEQINQLLVEAGCHELLLP